MVRVADTVSVARVLVVSFVVAGLFGAVPSASADKILFKRLSRATGQQAWVMRSDGSGLWVVEVASGAAREIVGFDDGSSVGHAVWSPDGQTIAFDRYLRTDTEEKGQLWTVNPDGGGLRQLTQLTGGAAAPSWCPNGRRIAITTRAPQESTNIATIRADGSGLRILTHSRLNLEPDWSR